MFLFATLLGKQWVSRGISCLGIRWQKFKGNAGVMGWKRQEVGGGIWLEQGSCCPQLSCSCPPWLKVSPRLEGHQQERKEGDEGVQIQGIDQRSLEGGWSVCVSVYVCFSDSTHCHPLPSPVLTHTGTAWPDVPLASDIFICSEQPLLREGDPRDAPEQILTSSIRSLWCAGAKARGRHPSAGSAQNAGSAESIEEWEDIEVQTGQTPSQTWRPHDTFWGQGNASKLWVFFIYRCDSKRKKTHQWPIEHIKMSAQFESNTGIWIEKQKSVFSLY